jgi:Pentapeptide repeats (8 copies)
LKTRANWSIAVSIRDIEDNWEREPRHDRRLSAVITALPYLVPVGILLVLAISIIALVAGAYTYGWEWTGFLGKTLWDWMKLLLVPAILALGGLLITQMERYSAGRAQEIQLESIQDDRRNAREQYMLQRESMEENQRNSITRFRLEQDRQQDDRLQAYLDRMTQLLLENDTRLRQSEQDEDVRMLARAWTLTMLDMLQDNPRRKSAPVQFLHAAGLIERGHAFVLLSGANLRGADLRDVRLNNADLSNTDLGDANLAGADLSVADLSGANLEGAEGVTDKQLDQLYSLKDATMPNGQKYEDWRKDREGSGADE